MLRHRFVGIGLAFLLAFLVSPAQGQEGGQEVRSMKLIDGRSLIGIVVEATAEGMRLEIPQGSIMIPYSSLAEIDTSNQRDYDLQPPLKIAVAPTGTEDSDDREIARALDRWLPELVALIPHTEVMTAAAWAQNLAAEGTKLHGCNGEIACLRALSTDMGVDRVLVPQLGRNKDETRSFRLMAVITRTGGTLAPATMVLPAPGGQPLASESGAACLAGSFKALGVAPMLDTAAAAASLFSAPEEDKDLQDRGGKTANLEVTKDPWKTPSVSLEGEAISTRPVGGTSATRIRAGRLQLSRAQAVPLGFAPVPGLTSALLGDPRGFAISLAGTIALSWLAVYAIGKTARAQDSFWVPTVLAPYAICVGFNQLSIAFGRKKVTLSPISKGGSRPSPRVGGALAPVLSTTGEQPGRPSGASMTLIGSF
ncbi:MAG: hypothetical protein VX498_12255 [Myxococcota bacterium]|nr:hypothetical protein [Myxococcota bacterium]